MSWDGTHVVICALWWSLHGILFLETCTCSTCFRKFHLCLCAYLILQATCRDYKARFESEIKERAKEVNNLTVLEAMVEGQRTKLAAAQVCS